MKTKTTAIILSIVMILGLTAGCADTSFAMTINGENVAAGEYILAQLDAAQKGAQLFAEENPETDVYAADFDYFKHQVEGVPFADWVNNEAIQICKNRAATAILFDELSLELPPDAERNAKNMTDELWANSDGLSELGITERTLGDFFEGAGVSKASYTAVMLYREKTEMAFLAYYAPDGVEPVSTEELQAEFAREFARFRMIEMTPNELADAATLEELANSYAARLNDGESFGVILEEYFEYERALNAPPEEETTAEEPELAEETPTEEPETTELDQPETVPDETDETDETVILDEPETEPEEPTADETDETEELETEQDEQQTDETPLIDDDYFDILENREYPERLNEGALDFVFGMQVGTAAVYKDEESIYVFQRLDVNEREDWFENYSEFLLRDLKSDEFEEVIKERGNALDVVINEDAIKRYKPQKIAKKGLIQ